MLHTYEVKIKSESPRYEQTIKIGGESRAQVEKQARQMCREQGMKFVSIRAAKKEAK